MAKDELDCAIYVDVPGQDVLLSLLAETIGGRVDRWEVDAPGVELYVDDNDEADATRRTAFPDGFLHFSHEVEVYVDEPPATTLVTRLLERLWAAGWPAVASCDYEDDLPHNGGYKSPDVPWPR